MLAALGLLLLRLSVLCVSFWLLARLIEREALWRLATRLRLCTPFKARVTGLLILLVLSTGFSWAHVGALEAVRPLAFGLMAMLSWKLATTDYDVVLPERHDFARLSMMVSCLLMWWHPAWVVVPLIFLTRPFYAWRHHTILPMRSLLAVVAYIYIRQLEPWLPPALLPLLPQPSTLLFLVVNIHASHYLSAGYAKLTLGSRWSSWVLENPLQLLPANAYAWGWAQFIPWEQWRWLIRGVERLRVPSLLACLLIELLAPLALLGPHAALSCVLSWCGFHLMVFLMSGLLFWDWMVANGLLLLALFALPPTEQQALFGVEQTLLSLAFILLFPMKNRLWGPIMLAWWETPLTQRMHWLVQGRSGQLYEVYNHFMCPHERLYGVVHATFMAPVPLLSYDMGSVWEAPHRDALLPLMQHPERLEEVRQTVGIQPRHPVWEEQHLLYLQAFFAALNRGAQKHVLPRFLRWLKAPGGHIYAWGALPSYRQQEPVERVFVHFREMLFDGHTLQTLRDERVATVEVDGALPTQPTPREPSSRDVERFISGAFWQKKVGS